MSGSTTDGARRPVSRRDRPAKPPLSRELIVDTMLAIVRRESLEAATMRRVASALDTGPASLYVYFANTTELRIAVLDAFLEGLVPPATGDWRMRIERLLADYRDRLLEHPELARAALLMRPAGPNAMALFDHLLGLFIEHGVPPRQAAWGVDKLLLTATAIVAEHATDDRVEPGDDLEPDQRQRAIVDAVRQASSTTRYLARHAEDVVAGSPHERWDWWARCEIDAIARASPPPANN